MIFRLQVILFTRCLLLFIKPLFNFCLLFSHGCFYLSSYLLFIQFYLGIYLQWNSICLELPHCALKLVCAGMVQELKRQNRHIPALSIASAINERLNCLLPTFSSEGVPADRALMFSEAARRDTFIKWPHMNYKYVTVEFHCIVHALLLK